uniref:Uncharacterized protein n=1 Tax=Zea mays TaxID=4577 RepID=A0A804MAQ1_MAIZE
MPDIRQKRNTFWSRLTVLELEPAMRSIRVPLQPRPLSRTRTRRPGGTYASRPEGCDAKRRCRSGMSASLWIKIHDVLKVSDEYLYTPSQKQGASLHYWKLDDMDDSGKMRWEHDDMDDSDHEFDRKPSNSTHKSSQGDMKEIVMLPKHIKDNANKDRGRPDMPFPGYNAHGLVHLFFFCTQVCHFGDFSTIPVDPIAFARERDMPSDSDRTLNEDKRFISCSMPREHQKIFELG